METTVGRIPAGDWLRIACADEVAEEDFAWPDAAVNDIRQFDGHYDFPVLRRFDKADIGGERVVPCACVRAIDGREFAVGVR